jgi:hypothetical protein
MDGSESIGKPVWYSLRLVNTINTGKTVCPEARTLEKRWGGSMNNETNQEH